MISLKFGFAPTEHHQPYVWLLRPKCRYMFLSQLHIVSWRRVHRLSMFEYLSTLFKASRNTHSNAICDKILCTNQLAQYKSTTLLLPIDCFYQHHSVAQRQQHRHHEIRNWQPHEKSFQWDLGWCLLLFLLCFPARLMITVKWIEWMRKMRIMAKVFLLRYEHLLRIDNNMW